MERKARYSFAAVFEKEDNGSYSVRFPALDGCFTQGKDFEEAYAMAQDAMSLHLYGMEEDGEEIPQDQEIPQVTAPETVVMVTAWMTPFRESMRNQSVKKTLTIPAWLNAEAEKRHVNYSQLLQNALKDYLFHGNIE